uniref:R13L1/DRL21-like LRR repeat region domain-containing protein n=1 Tax=Quercus lobata TaxID=97700 RepID=A0A7N2LCT2_QUELO
MPTFLVNTSQATDSYLLYKFEAPMMILVAVILKALYTKSPGIIAVGIWRKALLNGWPSGCTKDVLEKLVPHTNVNKLQIHNYGGTRFRGWLGDDSFCNILVAVGPEFYGNNSLVAQRFLSLEILKCSWMSAWEEWCSIRVEDEFIAFPRLQELHLDVLLKYQDEHRALLGCTNAAPRPAHPRPTRRDAATREGRRRPRVRPASCRVAPRGGSRLGPTRADAAKIGADAAEIDADAAEIGPTRSVSAISAGDRYGRNRNRPKQAGISRNRPKLAVKIAGEAEILASDAFLALFFLCFVNQVY